MDVISKEAALSAQAISADVDRAVASLDGFTPDQLRAAIDRNPNSQIALALRETTALARLPDARGLVPPAGENEAHNFHNLMRIQGYLSQHGLMLTPYTEETHGPMAPAENFIASVDALRLRASLAPERPSVCPPNIADDLDFMSLLASSAEDIRSRDKWGRVIHAITAWYIREAELQRQAELEHGDPITPPSVPAGTPGDLDPASASDRAQALAALEWLYERARPTFGTLRFVELAIVHLRPPSENP